MKYTALRYVAADGKDHFGAWLKGLKDIKAKTVILKRIERLESGSFGDCKPCRENVSELRIDYGPGYRIYFGLVGKALVLLLCAGDKRSQQADIERAIAFLKDFKERTREKS